MNNCFLSNLLCYLLFILLINNVWGQEPLTTHQKYFDKQILEYQDWLNGSGLSQYFSFYEFLVEDSKVSLTLKSNFKGRDSLAILWESFSSYEDQVFVEEMLRQLSFLLNVDLNLTEIIIQDNDKERIYIFHNQNGIQIRTHFPQRYSPDTHLITRFKDDVELNTYSCRFEIASKESVTSICKIVSDTIRSYFQGRSTKFRTIYEKFDFYHSSFTYEVVCIKNEVISRYFENIQIEGEFSLAGEKGEKIAININIRGKYCASWRCPKFYRHVYKNMDNEKYQDQLIRYKVDWCRKLKSYLYNSF